MSQNHISLDLTDEQVTTARAGLDQLATALTGLVAIPDSERRNPGPALGGVYPADAAGDGGQSADRAAEPGPGRGVGGPRHARPPAPPLEDLQKLVARLSDTVDLLGSNAMDVALDGSALGVASNGQARLPGAGRRGTTRRATMRGWPACLPRSGNPSSPSPGCGPRRR